MFLHIIVTSYYLKTREQHNEKQIITTEKTLYNSVHGVGTTYKAGVHSSDYFSVHLHYTEILRYLKDQPAYADWSKSESVTVQAHLKIYKNNPNKK